jgi:hypothetical protein
MKMANATTDAPGTLDSDLAVFMAIADLRYAKQCRARRFSVINRRGGAIFDGTVAGKPLLVRCTP